MFEPIDRMQVAAARVPRRTLAARDAANRNTLEAALHSPMAWRVAGILFLVTAEAILHGFSYPYFSLALERRELAGWLIGLNASVAGAGILIVGPFLPRLIDVFGLRTLVAGLFATSLLSFAAVLAVDHVAVWFVSRFVMGACFAALWTTTEVWLNATVDERLRGRAIGGAMTLYAGAQFVGPLMLSATGAGGALPLLAAMLPLAAGFFVALSIRSPSAHIDESHEDKAASLRLALKLAGPLIGAGVLAGVAGTAIPSLLPVFAIARDLSDVEASQLVAIFGLGEAVLVAALGFFADRYDRGRLMRTCAVPAIALAVVFPFAAFDLGVLAPLLFLAGGTISGIYMLAIIIMGQDFRGRRLAVVATGFAMAYAAGSILGSTPIGLLIDLFGPAALPFSLGASFLGLGLLALLPPTSIDAETAPHVGDFAQDNAPSLILDEGETVHVEEAVVGDLQVRDDRERQERDLEKWFLERASEAQRRATQRYEAVGHRLEGAEADQSRQRKGKLGKDRAA
jgi:MFS family permease